MNVFELTRALVDIESITNNEECAGDFIYDYLSPLAALYGGRVERLEVEPRRCNVFAQWGEPLVVTIIEKYEGGPVGVNTLAAVLAEEPDAIEEIYEPFLMQIGFLNRTPRGRVATQLAYEYFKITPTRRQSSLF